MILSTLVETWVNSSISVERIPTVGTNFLLYDAVTAGLNLARVLNIEI